MADIDDFQPLVLPFAGNAPEPLVMRAIRDAATQFCERTKLWRGTATIVTTGENPEAITVPTDAILYTISSCALDGRPLDPITLSELATERPYWRTDDIGCGGARWYVAPERGTIQAVPRSSGTLFVEFVVKPTATAAALPDFLLDEYGPVIADGAAGALLIMPNMAFANPQLGAGLIARFQSKLDSLANAGTRGQQGGRTRTRGRYF
jgi:hypothetical protein